MNSTAATPRQAMEMIDDMVYQRKARDAGIHQQRHVLGNRVVSGKRRALHVRLHQLRHLQRESW